MKVKKKISAKLSPGPGMARLDQSALHERAPFVSNNFSTELKQKHRHHNMTQVGFFSSSNELSNYMSPIMPSPVQKQQNGLKSSRMTVFNVLDSKVDRIGMLPSPQERYLPNKKLKK